jgi:hypothetical protein
MTLVLDFRFFYYEGIFSDFPQPTAEAFDLLRIPPCLLPERAEPLFT